jgi:hypothetical protein
VCVSGRWMYEVWTAQMGYSGAISGSRFLCSRWQDSISMPHTSLRQLIISRSATYLVFLVEESKEANF